MTRLIHPGIAILVLSISVLYIIFSSVYELHWAHEIFTEFSIAGIVFGTLGLTLEPSMRRSLARDVFRAAFGYHMPDDFKAEIVRIADYTVICTRHIMEVKIQHVNSESIPIILTIERHLKNISVMPRLQRGMVWIDDWGFEEPAKIIQCDITNQSGSRRKRFNPKNIEHLADESIRTQTPRMLLAPQETVIVNYEYSAVKRQNHQFIEWFLAPTRNPEIRVIEKPADINVTAGFGSDLKLKYTNISDRYELDGAYFPTAVMKIRWWPKIRQ